MPSINLRWDAVNDWEVSALDQNRCGMWFMQIGPVRQAHLRLHNGYSVEFPWPPDAPFTPAECLAMAERVYREQFGVTSHNPK